MATHPFIPPPVLPPPVLIGYRGCGKTTVGRLVADRLGVPLLDTDALAAAAAGRPIAEIFAVGGEAAFRDLEERAVAEALPAHAVVATGGGAVVREANRRRLAACGRPIVYLRCGAAELARRLAADGGNVRPALTDAGDAAAEVAAVLASREPLYQGAATAVVEVEGLAPAAVAEAVLASVAPKPRS